MTQPPNPLEGTERMASPPVGQNSPPREDVVDGARLAVAGLYHLVAHTLMSEQEPEAHRQGLQKMLF